MTPLALVLALAAADPFAAFLADEAAVTTLGAHQARGMARAVGPGRVAALTEEGLVVSHVLYDNHTRKVLKVDYRGVSPLVKEGARVKAGTALGAGRARVRYALDDQPTTRKAIKAKARFDPRAEAHLILIDQETYEMRRYSRGVEQERLKVGFGQAKGAKRVQGDNRTPKGMYFVTNKHRGAFGGKWGEYYGGHWIKISYPNPWDADRGLDEGLINRAQAKEIAKRWAERALPTQRTKLGGGIGFHGWIGPWDDDDPHLSWGCIVMHNADIKRAYDDIPVGAMVVVF